LEQKLLEKNIKIRNTFLSSGCKRGVPWVHTPLGGDTQGGVLVKYYNWRFVKKNLGFLAINN